MRRPPRDSDLRVRGMNLGPRFVLSTTLALTMVMTVAAVVLYTGVTNIAQNRQTDTISRAVRLTFEAPPFESDATGREHVPTGVQMFPFRYGEDFGREGMIYRYRGGDEELRLFVPSSDRLGKKMLGMIVGILLAVVLVGAAVAYWAANQVSRPIRRLVEDVRQIAKGDLQHKTRAIGVGEVQLLARSIDRMTRELEEGQDAEVELSVREREMDVAAGVREALLPLATPMVEGYDLGAVRISSSRFGGDFHDFVEREDGRVGLLVCDVSGTGVPAALVGATARSYLRSELLREDDLASAFRRVNRWLVGDVRRGMFVTALYAQLDPARGRVSVVCAGHKLPLLRYTAADGRLRVVHPEGIALGFDRGPVFDRRLEVLELELAPGDRLFLSNSTPVSVQNASGRELGEKAFYRRVLKHAPEETLAFLKAIRRDLEQYAGTDEVPLEVSLVTITRVG